MDTNDLFRAVLGALGSVQDLFAFAISAVKSMSKMSKSERVDLLWQSFVLSLGIIFSILLLIFSAVDGIGWELRGPGRYYLGSKNTKQRKQQKQKGKNKDQFF